MRTQYVILAFFYNPHTFANYNPNKSLYLYGKKQAVLQTNTRIILYLNTIFVQVR